MRDVDRVLASIDGVLDEGGYDGVHTHWDDAMSWSPPWDEPVVRDPETFVEELTRAGWDGLAAQAYRPLVFWRGLSDPRLEDNGTLFPFEMSCTVSLIPETVVHNGRELQDALRAAAEAGGGTIVLAAGEYAVAPIRVPPNVTLRGDLGAAVSAAPGHDREYDWPLPPVGNVLWHPADVRRTAPALQDLMDRLGIRR